MNRKLTKKVFICLLIFSLISLVVSIIATYSNISSFNQISKSLPLGHEFIERYKMLKYESLVNLIITVCASAILVLSFNLFLRHKNFKPSLLLVIILFCLSLVINLIFKQANLQKNLIGDNIYLDYLTTIISISTYIVLYLSIVKNKYLNLSFIGLFLVQLLTNVRKYYSTLTIIKTNINVVNNDLFINIQIYELIIVFINLVILLLLLLIFLKYSNLKVLLKHFVFSIYFFVTFFLIYSLLYHINFYEIQVNYQIFKQYLGRFIVIILSLPTYILIGTVLLLLIDNKTEVVKLKNRYFLFTLMGMLILAWCSYFIKSSNVITSNYPYINNVQIKTESKKMHSENINGLKYLISYNTVIYKPNKSSHSEYVLYTESTNYLGFKEYHNVVSGYLGDSLNVISDCQEECKIYVFGFNEFNHNRAIIQINNDESIIIELKSGWILQVIENDDLINSYIKSVKYE